MANGGGPDCVTCANFDCGGTESAPVNVRDPKSRCVCLFHRVVLPLAQTSGLLLCREWKHRNADQSLGFIAKIRYKTGMLYAFPNEYARPKPWRLIAELPKVVAGNRE